MGQKKRKNTLEVSSHDKEERTEEAVQSVGGKNSVLAKKRVDVLF